MSETPSTKISALPAVVAANMLDADVLSGVFNGITSKASITDIRAKLGLVIPPGRTVAGPAFAANNVLFNIMDIAGADGTGVGDDTAQVLAAATLAAAANATLYSPPGKTFKISSPIVVNALNYFGVIMHGSKFASTIVDDGTSDAAFDIVATSSSRISLAGLRGSHTYVSGSTLLGLRVSAEAQSVFAEDVAMEGFPYYGGDVQASQHVWINPRFRTNRHGGLFVGGAGTISVLNGDVSDNGSGSVTEGYGLGVSGGNTIIVGGRYVDNDRMNLELRRADNAIIDGAYVYNAGLYGIYAVNEDSEKDAKNIKIVNCTIDMNNRVGSDHAVWIGMFGAGSNAHFNEALVKHNTIKNVLGKGVFVSSGTGAFTVQKANVSDNIMEEVDGAAVEVGGTTPVAAATIVNNILKNTGNIVTTNVERPSVRGNIRYLTAGNASNFVACTGDLDTIIKDNISDSSYTAQPFTWTAPRYEVGGNIAQFGASSRELVSSKTAVPDNAATAFLTISVPNVEIGGVLLIDYLINDADKGDIYYSGQLKVLIDRYPGIVAKASIVNSIAETSLSTASGWGRTIANAFTAVQAGAVGAVNTITLKITSDTSDSLTSTLRYRAKFLFGGKVDNTSEMTMVAA